MLYRFQFRNIKEELYTIQIQTGNNTQAYTGNVNCGDPACVIKSESSGLYAPIKSRSCEINLVVHDYMFDLYSKTPKNTKVWIYDNNSTCVFFGYLTPCVYNQSYTYLDTLTLEAVDAVSVLKDIYFETANMSAQLNFKDLVCALLQIAGYTGNVYVPNTYNRLDGSSVSHVLEQLYISGGNFFGDDDQHLPLTDYEVLTEILKYMGWSLCPDGMDVWLIDYRSESQGSVTYKPYSITTGTGGTTVSKNQTINISTSNEAGGTPQISMDDIYNKITVSANLFEIDELAPDLEEDSIHKSVTETIQLNTGTDPLNVSQWTKQRRKSFLWWSWNSGSPVPATGVDYQTFCTFAPSSGWTHTFYHTYNPSISYPNVNDSGTWAGFNWYDTTTNASYSNFKGQPINKYMNTVGCLMQHHAVIPNTDNPNLMPTSVSWEDYLTFFILNDRANSGNAESMTAAQIRQYELPVLQYHIPDILNYKPRSGTNWIVISGNLWYQSGGTYKDKDNKTWVLNLFGGEGSNQYYVTCPIDKPDVEGDLYYDSWQCTRTSSQSGYGSGWPMWKMQLKIGDKYWNGTTWTTTQSTFSINYNNSPDTASGTPEMEALVGFDWMKTCSNTTYKDKVGEDGYCIPINDTDSGSFIGDFTLTVYCPSILPQGKTYSGSFSWKNIPNMIYVKDFDLDYVYTDSQVWYKQHNKSYKDDYIYTGYIDSNITKNFSDLKLKVNTALAESPISRSFVCSSNGFISTMRHDTYASGSGQVQEKNILDQYLDHYKEPKPIYEVDLHGDVKPWYKYQYSYLSGYTFLLDSYEMDLKYCKNRLKLIAF